MVTSYPGVVRLDDDSVKVSVGLGEGRVRLVAGDQEIGDWPDTDCVFTETGSGEWLIVAEQETLAFTPDEPGKFALRLSSMAGRPTPTNGRKPEPPDPVPARSAGGGRHRDPEAPQALTVVGFYMLAAITAVLGIWALLSIIN